MINAGFRTTFRDRMATKPGVDHGRSGAPAQPAGLTGRYRGVPIDDVTATAPPQLSPDGHWWWDGMAWIPAAERPGAPVAVAPVAVAAAVAVEPVLVPVAETVETVLPADESQPEPDPEPEPVVEQQPAPSWAAAPMPGNGIPHQAGPVQPFVAQPYVPQQFGGPPMGYSLAAAQSPGKTLGIVSLVLSLLWLGGLGSIGAIITGHMSRSTDRKAGAPQSGLALAGLILGYLGAVATVLILVASIALPVFLDQRAQARSAGLTSELRSAAVVQETLMTDYGSYATSADELVAAGYSGDPSVRLEVLAMDGVNYCLGAVVPEVGEALYFDSATGTVSPTPCY
jgi:hypothetical protein